MNMGKMLSLGLLSAIFLVFLAPLAFAITCSDGTFSGYCSTVNPGKVCEGGSLFTFEQAPDRMAIIQKDPSAFADCTCPSGQALDTSTWKCKSTSCTVDGSTYNDGSCVTTQKPKQCIAGSLVDKASICGCPSDYDVLGETCKAKTGCIVSKPACESGYECNQTTNSCQKKLGCAYDNPSCATSEGSSDFECDLNANKCFKKSGCLYDNPTCKSTEKCVSNRCVAKEAPPAPITPDDGGATTGEDTSGSQQAKLLCCPVVFIFLLVLGIAFWKRE